jgi:hypothetical protein
MPDLPQRKVGIVACSGEELAEGTVTRLAVLKVLHELRPRDTVTICLPLFLAGGQGERAFARFHPTITVDGCELRCAARATEMYSGKPAASLVVNELVAERGLGKPEGRRRLNEAGNQAVEVTAAVLADAVDKVLGSRGPSGAAEPQNAQGAAQPTCSCGSGIPVTVLTIEGRSVELVALPLVLRQFRDSGRRPDEALARELLDTVKVYNFVPPEAEGSYREAVLREYLAFCEQEQAG